jgi:hypothetical protein
MRYGEGISERQASGIKTKKLENFLFSHSSYVLCYATFTFDIFCYYRRRQYSTSVAPISKTCRLSEVPQRATCFDHSFALPNSPQLRRVRDEPLETSSSLVLVSFDACTRFDPGTGSIGFARSINSRSRLAPPSNDHRNTCYVRELPQDAEQRTRRS